MINKVNSSINSAFVSFQEAPISDAKKQSAQLTKNSSEQKNTQPSSAKTIKASQPHKEKYDKDTLLKNNVSTRVRIAFDKLTNAGTVYTAKGLTGSKNANFYEFLTMGTIPYLLGSVTLMGVFNLTSKYYDPSSKNKALKFGNKMALGVIFYALAKEMAKPLVTKPVQWKTGVDVNLPYAKVIYELPDSKDDSDITSIEYHKVFESVEFPRWDLLYADEAKGEKRNAYYDKVAKKLGLGENLKDSDQEVKPRIKAIATKTIAVNNIVPYLWATAGVALAMQKPWENFFPHFSLKFWKLNEQKNSFKAFGKCFKSSAIELYNGGKNATKCGKIAGKAVVLAPVIATALGVIDIISNKKVQKNTDTPIDKNRKYVVS